MASVAGAALGEELARSRSGSILSGIAWSATTETTRAALATIFGVQMTVAGIVLTLNALVLQIAANQYSPRLQARYARGPWVRCGIVVFAFSAAYVLVAELVLGLESMREGAEPRPVIAGAFILLILFVAILIHELMSTFASLRIEVILRSLAAEGIEALARLRAAQAWARGQPARFVERPADAIPLRMTRRGYIVGVDLVGLGADAWACDVVIRIDRWIGDYVTEGEIVGWISSESATIDEKGALEFARALRIARARRPTYDLGLALRLLVDIADRALSPGINDPYTARQALNECRPLLCQLAREPPGDCVLHDPDGRPRVSVAFPTLRDYLSLVVDGPARFGALDGDTIDALLAIAREVGLASTDANGRECALAVARRVLGEARGQRAFESQRLRLLEASVADLERAISAASPFVDIHPAWGISTSPSSGSGSGLITDPGAEAR